MSFLEQVSSGHLSCLRDVPDGTGQLSVLLHAIPDTVSLESIRDVLGPRLDNHPVWLVHRGVQVERNTGNIDEAIRCFQHAKHPLAPKLATEYSCFKHVLDFFAAEPDIHRRLTFSCLQHELLKLDHAVLIDLALFLVQKGFVLPKVFDAVFKDKLVLDGGGLMEEIF